MTFAVTIEQISEILVHPNADRLEIAKLVGMDYSFVVGKGNHKQGDTVIHFPLDSLLPEDVLEKLGLVDKLSGKERNRVKTIKLRGQISQGLICEPATLGFLLVNPGEDLTEELGVVKYEPPEVQTKSGNLVQLPACVAKYDIENAQKYTKIVELLMDDLVFITEKIEGSHWFATLLTENNKFIVGQRNYDIEPIESSEHTWWKVAREGEFEKKLQAIANLYLESSFELKSITIRGEIIGAGIQGNYYQLKKHIAYAFEIELNGKPIPAEGFIGLCKNFEIQTVPVLAYMASLREWLNNASLADASNGISSLVNRKREGIVIKPLIEQRHEDIGRVVLKQRSPEYLLKEK